MSNQLSLFNIIEEKQTVIDIEKNILSSNCTDCSRSTFRIENPKQKITISNGNPEGKFWIMGKSPGVNDGETGIPYSHGSGKVLINMMEYVGLDWSTDCYAINPVFCADKDDKVPTVRELKECSKYVDRIITAGSPALFIGLGSVAIEALTDKKIKISEIAGATQPIETKYGIPLWPFYHTATLFKYHNNKPKLEEIQLSMLKTLNALKHEVDKIKGIRELTPKELSEEISMTLPNISLMNSSIARKLRWTNFLKDIEEELYG